MTIHLNNRLIAMFDVLGFANQINDPANLASVGNEYCRIIKIAKNHQIRNNLIEGKSDKITNFEVGEFVFDNIVIVSNELSTQSISNFILSMTILMETFFENRFPLRGAISIGDYYADPECGIFLSNLFKRLSHAGDMQEWTGCVVLDEAEEVILNSIYGHGNQYLHNASSPLIRYPAPFKEGWNGNCDLLV